MFCVSSFAIIDVTSDRDISFIAIQGEHSEQVGLPSGPGRAIFASLPNRHFEAFVDSDGALGVYTWSKAAQRVVDAETQDLTTYTKTIREQIKTTKISLTPSVQEGDAPSRISRFQSQLPKDLVGRPLWASLPNISSNSERFRFRFIVTEKENKLNERHSEEVELPKKAGPEDDETLYLTGEGVIPPRTFKQMAGRPTP